MMKILAIDTSNLPLSVAVAENDTLLATTTTNRQRNHATSLMPLIDATLSQANISKNDLDRIAVAMGPGSYTGVRIGLSVAKMLAYALRVELVAYSSLQVLAYPLKHLPNTVIVPVFDARRDNVFAGGWLAKNNELIEVIHEQHINIDHLLTKLSKSPYPVVFVGSDARHFATKIAAHKQMTLASSCFATPQAFCGGLMTMDAPACDPNSLVPNYLRKTQAEVQWLAKHDAKDIDEYVEKYKLK